MLEKERKRTFPFGQNAVYGNGAHKIILRRLRKGTPQILKFLCLCSGTNSVLAHLAIFVRF